MSALSPEFLAWANNPGLQRAVAFVATIYRRADAEPLTLYLSGSSPRRGTWDNAHNWERCVLGEPSMQYTAQELQAGSSLAGFGSLELAQDDKAKVGPDGTLSWAQINRLYRFAGGPIQCLVGGPDLAWAHWGTAAVGSMGRPSLERGKLNIPLRSLSASLSKIQLPSDTYAVSDGVPSSTVGHVKPCCLGPCNNLTPVLVSESPYTYQVHAYGPIQAIAQVRVDDVAVTPASVDLAAGKFTLSAKPSGQVTCDVQGWVRGGVYLQNFAQMAEAILRQWGNVGDAQIVSAAFAAAASAAPQVLAAYWSTSLSIQQALDGLCLGLPIWWGDDGLGAYTLTVFGAPTGSPALRIYDGTSRILQPYGSVPGWDVSITPSAKWYCKVTVQGDRNYTPNSSPASSITTDRQAWLKEEYRSRVATTTAPADNPEVDELSVASCMASLDDCQASADTLASLHGSEALMVKCDNLYAGLALRKGDEVMIYTDQAGMDEGWPGVVTDISLALPSRATVTLWGPL